MNKSLLQKIKKAEKIFNSSELDWEEKYDQIFDMKLIDAIEGFTMRRFEYCDPDTTYQEDVTALMGAVLEWRNNECNRKTFVITEELLNTVIKALSCTDNDLVDKLEELKTFQ